MPGFYMLVWQGKEWGNEEKGVLEHLRRWHMGKTAEGYLQKQKGRIYGNESNGIYQHGGKKQGN